MQKLFIIFIIFISIFSSVTHAQETNTLSIAAVPQSEYQSGIVIGIIQDENGKTLYQTQKKDGHIIDLDTYGEEITIGSKVFIEYFPTEDYFNYVTVDRSFPILMLALVFVLSIIVLAGKKGIRSLLSLGASFLLLFMGLIPLLLRGYDPLWTTLIFGLGVLFLSIFVTHGFNRQSSVSFLGSLGSIIVAVVLLQFATSLVPMSGLINDHIQFLNFELNNSLNLVRIVSAGIIIGILGVLDDITITQVAVVRELSSDTTLSKKDIFKKALRVGRDHISSLVNTLVFAYMGATLPLIMFVTLLDIPFIILIGQEFIFVEIIRSLVGAIALTIAVPVTTYLAVFVFLSSIHKDKKVLESVCAHHHH
jgi:uncharacterized membrane protein